VVVVGGSAPPQRAMVPRSASVERYPYLGGLASGGMVLVLDDICSAVLNKPILSMKMGPQTRT